MASIIYFFPLLPAILLYFHTLHNYWWLAWKLVVFSHMVASIASIFPRCLQSCCILTHCIIIGGLPGILLYFRTSPNHWWLQSLKFSLLPAILLYFQTLPTHWWLQLLKFASVACNLVVVSNNAKYLVASII